MKENIFNLLRESGPMFPAEVSAKVGGNSFLAKAFLSELVFEGRIISDRMGLEDGLIYFLPGQEKLAEEKVKEVLNVKRTASMYSQGKKENINPELAEKQRKIAIW